MNDNIFPQELARPTITIKPTVALALVYESETLGIKPVRVMNDIGVPGHKVTALELNLSELVPLADALLRMADELGVAR